MKKILLLAIAILCLFVGGAEAGNRKQTYYNNLAIKQKVVEVDNEIQVVGINVTDGQYVPLYYWEVDKDKLTQEDRESLANEIANKVVSQLVSAFEEAIKGGTVVPTPQPQPDDSKPVNPEVEINKQVSDIFKKYKCTECHGTNRKESGFSLVEAPLKRDQKWDVFDQVESKSMPPKGDALTEEEVDVVRKWARSKDTSWHVEN